MKLIIAGGRTYQFGHKEHRWLNELADSLPRPITEVVHGGATGADEAGHWWAVGREYRVRTMPAAWKAHGSQAGPIRNRQMARYAMPDGVVALFPGGRGTASMKREAQAAGLTIREYPNRGDVP